MKAITRSLALAIATAFLTTASAQAGQCCTKAVDKAKVGKACAECVTHQCCKDAIKQAGAAVKPCEKCAAKKKDA